MEGLVMNTLARTSNVFPTFPSLLDNFFEGDMLDLFNNNFVRSNSNMPAVNVKENENDFQIEVAAPGMNKNDFKINYDNGRLLISSEKEEENKDDNENYTRREFNYQAFQRSFNVSEKLVNAEKIGANYNDGILHITLPKREEAKTKPAKEIKIS